MASTAVNFYKSLLFSESYYLKEAAAALNALEGTTTHTAQSVANDLAKAGMTAWDDFCAWGYKAENADGGYGVNPSEFFDLNTYYEDIAQVNKTNVADVITSITNDPITHYATEGFVKGVNPVSVDGEVVQHNSRADLYADFYFNEEEYLINKTAALNAENYKNMTWTVDKTYDAIQDAGMTTWRHFCKYGAFEKDANGDIGIDPSQYFDVSKYYEEKLGITEGYDSVESIMKAFKTCKIDPITHYAKYGLKEGIAPRATSFDAVDGNKLDPNGETPMSGNQLVDSLLITSWDEGWPNLNKVGLSQDNTLYYKFATAQDVTSIDKGYNEKYITSSNATQKAAFLDSMDVLNYLTGIKFQEISSTKDANILIFNYNAQEDDGDWTGLTTLSQLENQQFVMLDNSNSDNDKPVFGTDAYSTVFHEMGHALGLNHPFDTEGTNLAVLPQFIDNAAWSIMSYTDPTKEGNESWYVSGDQYYSPLDIITLGYLYGTDGLNGEEGITYA